jgi:Lon protease-like protein
MFELPLFPLSTVLFPGMPLELHIFEDRYKEMIGMCIEKRQPFGVVLLEQGRPELDPTGTSLDPKPFLVGCTAHITQVKPLADGRMNILVVGKDRFQVVSLRHDKPYLIGMVEYFPMQTGEPKLVQTRTKRLYGWMERYLRGLEKTGRIQFDPRHMPNDPTALAYLGAVLLENISPFQRQALLASDRMTDLIASLCRIYRQEVMLLEFLLNPPKAEFEGPFSLN